MSRSVIVLALAAGLLAGAAAAGDELTERQRKELAVFAINAGFGFALTGEVLKTAPSMEKVYESVATGLRTTGHSCAEVVDIVAPESGAIYPVTCRLVPGGAAMRTYRVDAVSGIAFAE